MMRVCENERKSTYVLFLPQFPRSLLCTFVPAFCLVRAIMLVVSQARNTVFVL